MTATTRNYGTPTPRLASPAGPFATFGEQLVAIRQQEEKRERGYADVDPRLIEVQRRGAAAGASEMVPADGGFLVQPEFSRELVRRMYNTGQILQRCTEMPITAPHANAIRFPQFDETSRANGSRLGGVQAYWENEAFSMSSLTTKPKFQSTELVAEKLTCICPLTNELLVDSGALDAWAQWAFTEEMKFKLEQAIISGTGAGQAQGITNSPALISIAPEAGQGTATILSQNVVKMLGRFWPPSHRSAIFLYNPELLPTLSQLYLVVSGGGSISNLWKFGNADNQFNSLAGFPAFPSEYCSPTGTAGDLILADFTRYVVAMRKNITTDVSIHLRFLTDETAFKVTMRVGGATIDKAPVIPYSASPPTDTQSSFIVLQNRP